MNDLMLNPNLRVEPVLTDGRVTAYALVSIVRDRGRLVNTVDIATADATLMHVLRGLCDASDDVEVDEAAYAPLVELGVLVHEHEISRRVAFGCQLDTAASSVAAELIANTEITVLSFDDFVRDHPLASVVALSKWIALVTDPVTRVRCPYWINDGDRERLERLVPGAPPPTNVDNDMIGGLAAAGILLDPCTVEHARRRVDAAAAQFARHQYAVVPQVLPAPQLAALRDYYRDLVREGHMFDSDHQVPLRHALHNELVMSFFHRELRELFARIVGDPIKPSYGYMASYRRGAMLAKHCDRKQCQFTASLLIDYAAGPSDDPSWPIFLELPETGEQVAAHLEPGDCVLFRGGELPHYRHALRGERSTSLFLHYVDESFAGPLE